MSREWPTTIEDMLTISPWAFSLNSVEGLISTDLN